MSRDVETLESALKATAKVESDGTTLVNYYQDVEPALDYAAACRREDAERRGAFGKRGEFRRTMTLPFNVIQEICLKYGLNFYEQEHAKRILEIAKRDYPAFKTTIDRRI